MNWAITGYGNIAKVFEDTLSLFKNDRLIGICTKKKIEKKNINISDKEDNIFSLKNLHAVYISNLNSMHLNSALNCIKYNVPFILEKPSLNSVSDFKNFFNNFKKKPVLFYEGYMNLFYPSFIKCLDLIKKKKIGKILKIKININFSIKKKNIFGFSIFSIKKNNRLRDPEKFGGSLNDIGCYCIAFANELFYKIFGHIPNPNIISAKKIYEKNNKIDLESSCEVGYENYFNLIFCCSMISNNKNFIEIYGENGSLTLTNPWVWAKDSKLIIEIKDYKKIVQFETKPRHFYLIKNFKKNLLLDEKQQEKLIKLNLKKLKINTELLENLRNA